MRYTPRRSVEALRQKWMTVDPLDEHLSPIGQTLAMASKDPKRFRRLVDYYVMVGVEVKREV